jgi:peptidase E
MVTDGALANGVAADDGVALHFEGTQLKHIVSSLPRASAWRVTQTGRRTLETKLPTRYLETR